MNIHNRFNGNLAVVTNISCCEPKLWTDKQRGQLTTGSSDHRTIGLTIIVVLIPYRSMTMELNVDKRN